MNRALMIIAPMSTSTTTLNTGAVRLNDWGVIRAQGEDAAKFLHSQLTQDFALLGLDEARLAGFCSAKGRLLATLIGWKLDEQEILLALPAELLPPILKRLSMFVLRAKCKLSDASADWPLWGLLSPLEQEEGKRWSLRREGEALKIHLPDAPGLARSLLAQPATAASPALPGLAQADWQWHEVEAGLAWVRAATSEQFVPQMINLEQLDGVNFQKGCYPGQEVVARSQYRGTIKRRTLMFAAAGEEAQIGQEIFHNADPEQPAGLVAAVAAREGQVLLLAEVKLAATEGGSLHLGRADGPLLQPRALPYTISAAE